MYSTPSSEMLWDSAKFREYVAMLHSYYLLVLEICNTCDLLPRHKQRCRNCGQHHPVLDGMWSSDCIVLGPRSHADGSRKRKRIPDASRLSLWPICPDVRAQALLFDSIFHLWNLMKQHNEDVRGRFVQGDVGKGELKAKAPLVWLEWIASDGHRGQTRNQENYDRIWHRCVKHETEEGQIIPTAWVSLRDIPVDPGQYTRHCSLSMSQQSPKTSTNSSLPPSPSYVRRTSGAMTDLDDCYLSSFHRAWTSSADNTMQ